MFLYFTIIIKKSYVFAQKNTICKKVTLKNLWFGDKIFAIGTHYSDVNGYS